MKRLLIRILVSYGTADCWFLLTLFLSGCLATRDWVREQMDPLSGRVSENENRIWKSGRPNSATGQ